MRLIDADILREQFIYTKELHDKYDNMPADFHELMETICNIIIEEIDKTPTIDGKTALNYCYGKEALHETH